MAQVHVDYANLQEFQQVLQRNIQSFDDIDQRTKQRLEQYEWNDMVADKFKTDFYDGMAKLNDLKRVMEECDQWLKPKIQALMAYHGR